MGDQPLDPRGVVQVEPGVEGVGVAGLQQAVLGHAMGRIAVGDLQQGGPALADVGSGIVVAQLKELVALLFGQE
jgi:hypothetical protein